MEITERSYRLELSSGDIEMHYDQLAGLMLALDRARIYGHYMEVNALMQEIAECENEISLLEPRGCFLARPHKVRAMHNCNH